MTSNIGARQLKDFGSGLGFVQPLHKTAQSSDNRHAKVLFRLLLKKPFAPEFLNRIDDCESYSTSLFIKQDIHQDH